MEEVVYLAILSSGGGGGGSFPPLISQLVSCVLFA